MFDFYYTVLYFTFYLNLIQSINFNYKDINNDKLQSFY